MFGRRGREADAYFRAALGAAVGDERGQSSVEYAVVMAAFLSIVVAIGAMASSLNSGLFVEHAVSAASHSLGAAVGGITDVFCF